MVPRERLELSLCYQNWILNPACLPIPPPRHKLIVRIFNVVLNILLRRPAPFTLAKNLGCKMQYLQDHYGQVETLRMQQNLVRRMKRDESGDIILD